MITLYGAVVKGHRYWLGDFGALIILATMGSSVGRIRQEVRSYAPMLRRLRSLCDWTGVRFGFRNLIFRGLSPFMLSSLLLSAAFLVAAMAFPAIHAPLRLVSAAFQILFTVGMVVFLMRDRSIRSTINKIESVAYSGRPTSPPKAAKFILLLVPKRHRENLIGDLEEEYATILLPEFGVRKARTWYWWQVTLSVGPFLWVQIKRVAAAAWLWKRVR
jgi:hypothetical protein